MIFGRKRGAVSLLLTGCILFTAEFEVLAADPHTEAQAMVTVHYEEQISPLAQVMGQIPELAGMAVETQNWRGRALANTDGTCYVYTEPSQESAIAGIMYQNTAVTEEETGAEWTKVTSGTVTGYVKNEWLLTGTAAVERAKAVCADGFCDIRPYEELSMEKLMAALIYCEAGNQPYDGKVAVGAVVMNRVGSGRFPNSIKEVVYQRGQFTPAMTGKLERILASGKIPASCYEAARDALAGASPVGGALYFNRGYGSFKLGDHWFH